MKNLMTAKKEANESYKQLVSSLDFVINTLNEMARTDERVKTWFDESGINVRPRQKKHEKEGKIYLTADIIIEAWDKELKDDEHLYRLVKGEKRVVDKFSAWLVMTMCSKYLRVKNAVKKQKAERKSKENK